MRFLLLLSLVASAFCDQRIVGGSEVSISDHPHQLSLRVSGSLYCGASLISTTRAVTAAHCSGSAIGVYTLLGGTSNRTDTSCDSCRLFTLTSIKIHPRYSENGHRGYPNDVAVLSFATQTFNGDFQAIGLAQPSDGSFAGDRCTITGWGLQQKTDPDLPILLQGADMTVMLNADCENKWGVASINDGHICLTDIDSGSCNGDSGGPLVCADLLAGATSWGEVSCSPFYPSVYSRISYFYSWIIAQ